MAWTTFSTFVTDQIMTPTDVNNIVGNLNYLFQRPKSKIIFDNGANYTISANTFANVDGINLTITLSVQSGTVLVTFSGVVSNGTNTTGGTCFDFTVDGTRYANAGVDGLIQHSMSSSSANVRQTVGFAVLVTGLSVGSHTFVLQWKALAGTSTLYAGAGSAGTDNLVAFNAVEVA